MLYSDRQIATIYGLYSQIVPLDNEVIGGVLPGENLILRSTYDSLKGQVIVEETAASLSSVSGSLRVNGGIGLPSTIDAVSTSNGGTLTTAGGAAIGKSLFVGGALTVSGGIVSGSISSGSTISATRYTSTISTGTAPLTVSSTTRVSNLNVDTAGIADTVITNANLSGPISSSGNTTSITSQTGTGTTFVMNTGPTISALIATGLTTLGTSTQLTVSSAGILTIPNTTASTSTTTGSVILSGGIGIAGALFGSRASFNSTATVASLNTFLSTTGAINTTGHIVINNVSTNILALGAAGIAVPNTSTRSDGTKIVLYPQVGAGLADYAIGIDANTIWQSLPTASSAFRYRWYGASTAIASLTGDGTFTAVKEIICTGTAASTSTSTGAVRSAGGIAISNATDATNADNGGSFTTAGGAAIKKNLFVGGAVSKGSGSFDIEHPIFSEKRLVHSFIEGPRCDNIYRGTTKLNKGMAIIDLDKDCVSAKKCEMSPGTFEALNNNFDFFLQNKSNFDQLTGKIEKGKLIIQSNNASNDILVSWMVVGERKDPFIKTWNRTDNAGHLITEYDVVNNAQSMNGQN